MVCKALGNRVFESLDGFFIDRCIEMIELEDPISPLHLLFTVSKIFFWRFHCPNHQISFGADFEIRQLYIPLEIFQKSTHRVKRVGKRPVDDCFTRRRFSKIEFNEKRDKSACYGQVCWTWDEIDPITSIEFYSVGEIKTSTPLVV